MTKKHLQFCIYYMQVGDPQVAYKMTYPRAAVKSLAAASSRLMARPDVAEWVHGTEERVHNRMMRQFHNEHYEEFKEKLLTINEKRTVLTKIIKGETKRVRYIKGKYGPQKVEEDLPVYAVLRAVDLDTRLENFYNYLTRSDTWRKTQNIYVNTPTLQQQVNILINQTTDNEETKDVQEPIPIQSQTASPPIRTARPGGLEGDRGTFAQDLSPAGGGVTPVTGVEPSRRTLAQVTPESETCLPPSERLGRAGFRGRGGELAQVTPEEPITSPLGRGEGGDSAQAGWVSSRRTENTTKKTPHFITTVNKIGKRKTSNASVPTPTPPKRGSVTNASVPTPHPHEANARPSQEGNTALPPLHGGV